MTSTHTATAPAAPQPCVHCGAAAWQPCAAGCFAEGNPHRRPMHPAAALLAGPAPAVDRSDDGERPPTASPLRPWTAPQPAEGGGVRFTVKRVCNGCLNELGDANETELSAAMLGQDLPDVADECPTCSPVPASVEVAGVCRHGVSLRDAFHAERCAAGAPPLVLAQQVVTKHFDDPCGNGEVHVGDCEPARTPRTLWNSGDPEVLHCGWPTPDGPCLLGPNHDHPHHLGKGVETRVALPPDRFARPARGFLGRTDWTPSGRHTVMSGADGAREPAAVSVWIGNREAAGSELVEIADRLNGTAS